MARPWIEFIQAQQIPWVADDLSGMRPGVEVRTLSLDDETGACSLLARYPAGWSGGPETLGVDHEFLVLEGSLQSGDRTYGRLSYAHLPAGYAAPGWSSPEGAVALTFFSARPALVQGPVDYDPERLVEYLDAMQITYTGNFHPEFPPGAGRKVLFTDPRTKETSWILGTLPLRWAERQEVHPVVEEMYLISGEVHGNRGVMRPGAYFWRPPNIPHGPYGTMTGNVYFFRTKGGPLVTEYIDGDSFAWDRGYDPALPDQLRPYAGEQARFSPPW
jgi:hypothetical protein